MNQDPWDQPRAEGRSGPGSEPGTQEGRPRRRRITALIVCLAVVLLAVWYIADSFVSVRDLLPGAVFPFISEDRDDDDFDDYGEWFDHFYRENEYDSDFTGEYHIPAADAAPGVTLALSEGAADSPLTLQEIYKKCAPSVTAIIAGVDDDSYYWGTGIVMTEDGYILTNAHVIDGAVSASVTLWNNETFDAKLVGADSLSDIAVLKIDAHGLTPAEFVSSASLQVGDEVIAIGNPLGEEFRGTMTNGIISAINRDIAYRGHTMTLLQTNAAINEGNSGGPLIDRAGRVIGVTNMKMISSYSSIEGIGFAIPTTSLKPVVDALLSSGKVTGRPGLGLTVGAIPEKAGSAYDLPKGLYISQVSEGSDCEAAGIRVGDILTAVNGIPVTTTDEVSAIRDTMTVGDEMTLTVWRDGETFDAVIHLMEMSDLYR
ncbi:MAG: S1C family serine protease [Clostridiales bacterium]|nr:S1C family serine protease [Clostridiales bacterium]